MPRTKEPTPNESDMTDAELLAVVEKTLWQAVKRNKAGVGDRQSILKALWQLEWKRI